MNRGARRLLAVTLVAGLLAGAAVWGLVLRDDLVTYRSEQEAYDDQAPVARVIELEGDDAALSVGSPDGRVLTVQFRDPGGEGWTAPQEVFRLDGRRRDFSDTTAREEAGTVAVLALFADGDEDDGDDLEIGLVCRDRSCVVRRGPGFGGEPEVAPDGRTAYLGEDENGAWLWSVSWGDIRHLDWTGHPSYGAGPGVPSQPALAPDGSLRVTANRVVPGGCRFTLLVSEPLSAALSPVASARRPRQGPSDSRCRPFLDVPTTDRVVVRPVDPGQRAFEWDRTDDGWVVTAPRARPE